MSEQVTQNTNLPVYKETHVRTRDVRVVDLLPEPLSSVEDVAASLEGPLCMALEALTDVAGTYDRGLALVAHDALEMVRAIGHYLRTGENCEANDYDRAMGYAAQDFAKTITHLEACHTGEDCYQGADGLESQFSCDTMPFMARALAEAIQAEQVAQEDAAFAD